MDASSPPPFWKQKTFWQVELAALAARLLFLLITHGMRRGIDTTYWIDVGQHLVKGENPYHTTTWLSWPPLWMVVISALFRTSLLLHVSFEACLHAFLIFFDLVLVAALYVLLQRQAPGRKPGSTVLWGLALNPWSILLTCQEGNFDALAGLCVILFLLAYTEYLDRREPVDWFFACLCAGLGILVKTTPLVLAPLLFMDVSRLPRRSLLLGLFLFAGPAAIGLSVIWALSPGDIISHVLLYRGDGGAGYIGLEGVLRFLNVVTLYNLFKALSPLIFGGTLLWLAFWLRAAWPLRRPEEAGGFVVQIAAAAMLAIPLFGPADAPQYLYWSLPALVAVYHLSDDKSLKRVFWIAYVVSAVNFIAFVSFLKPFGGLAAQAWSWARLKGLTEPQVQFYTELFTLPVFIALVVVFVKMAGAARSAASRA
jgi:hypothetical protein